MSDEPDDPESAVETRPCGICSGSGTGPDYRECQFCKGEGFLVVTLEDLEPDEDDDEGDWWEKDDDF